MSSLPFAGKMGWASQKVPGIVLGAFVVSIVGLLIVPLPTWLLDLLLAGNLGLSVVIILVTLYVSRALDIAVFPTLLLMTTLLRLGLNVASVRLILLDGYAGEVIGAFGQFVVRGNYAVGGVIFLVLCIIQYLVIAKGSERVAEVGARFVLDAMPGKQMAIDAEIRAGSIDNVTARTKRRELERESQFYGAMDGAMKFVKGDVIAGFIITFVNFIGGLTIGTVQRGLAVGDALRAYGLLTIGDGLVAQIPSMILAISAGILVTRVTGENERQSLPLDFVTQLLSVPVALRVAGAFVLLLALIPGLPGVPFFIIGALFFWGSFARERALEENKAKLSVVRTIEPTRFVPALVPWGIFVAPRLLPTSVARATQLTSKELPELFELIESLRSRLFRELGVIVPPCRVEVDRSIDEAALRVELREMTILKQELDAIDDDGVSALGEPLYTELRRNAGRFLGLMGTQTLLTALEEVDSVTVRQVVPKVVSLPLLSEVLTRLVDEGVSIRDLSAILTALGRVSPREKEPYRLTEALREELKDSLCYRFTRGGSRIPVVVLDPTLEDMIRMGITKTDKGQNLALSSSALRDVTTALTRAYDDAVKTNGADGVALLTVPEIRRHTRKLIEAVLPDVPVLAYSELPPELLLETLSTASLFGIDAE
jgi:type III secretion protein V